MLNLLEVMAQWVAEHRLDHRVQMTHHVGVADVPKRSAVVGFETESALGSIAVWETGEVEAEIVVVDTLDRPLVISTVVTTNADLIEVLERVARKMREL